MTEGEKIGLGHYAETLLNNPAYQHAIVALKAELFETFSSTKWFDKRERDETYRRIQTVKALEEKIESMMNNGKYLEQMESRQKQMRAAR